MQQQPFAPVQKAQPENVVVHKRRRRIQQAVPHKLHRPAAGAPARVQQARNLLAVAVHVFQINFQRRIGVVQHVALQLALGPLVLRRRVRTHPFAEPGRAALEQPQLVVGIKPAVTNPFAEVQIQPRNPVGRVLRRAGQQRTYLLLQFRRQHLVGVQQQNPLAGAQLQRHIFLLAVPAKCVITRLRPKALGNLNRAVLRARVHHDDLVGPTHTFQRARKVRLLVHRNHGNR